MRTEKKAVGVLKTLEPLAARLLGAQNNNTRTVWAVSSVQTEMTMASAG